MQETRRELVDDLDGSKANETISFGLDGTYYAIDLSDANAQAFRDLIAPYTKVAKRLKQRARHNVPTLSHQWRRYNKFAPLFDPFL